MADADARAQLSARGIHPVSPADALAGMADLMVAAGSAPYGSVVARIDWARFLPIYLQAGRAGLLAEMAGEVPDIGGRSP